jgi:lysophospholipase L1-like esterase
MRPFHALFLIPFLLATSPAGGAAAGDGWAVFTVPAAGGTAVRALHLREGRVREEALTLSSAGQECLHPAVAVSPGGLTAAVWIQRGRGLSRVMVTRHREGTWVSPREVARSTEPLMATAAAVGRGGDVWVAWVEASGGRSRIGWATLDGGGATTRGWIGEGMAYAPVLEVGEDGGIGLGWRVAGEGSVVRKRARWRDGAWSAPETSPAAPGGDPSRDRLQDDDELAGLWGRLAAGVPPAAGPPVVARGGGRPRSLRIDPLRGGARPTAVFAGGGGTSGTLPGDRTYVMGLGDSTTYGRGSSRDGPPTDYLSRLIQSLPGPWKGVNRGVPGDTSDDILDRVDQEISLSPAGLVIIMAGINDAYWGYPSEVTLTNLRSIVGKVVGGGGRFLLATTPPISPRTRPGQYAELVFLNQRIWDMAREMGYPVVDVWGKFHRLPDWETYVEPVSGNHLVDEGYQLLATWFRDAIWRHGLLKGDISWEAFDPPAPDEDTAAENAAAILHLTDHISSLALDAAGGVGVFDPAGSGHDLVAVVSDLPRRQRCAVYSLPPANPSSPEVTEPSVARVTTCNDLLAGGRVSHLFGVDLEGDGRDELGLVALDPAGVPFLEVWSLLQDTPPQRLVHDRWNIPAGGRVIDITALQADGDPADEIALLRQTSLEPRSVLAVFDAPLPGSDTEEESTAPLLYQNSTATFRESLGIAGQDVDGDGRDEVVILRSNRAGMRDRLLSWALPELPAAANTPVRRLALDIWTRTGDPHAYWIRDLVLDDGSGGSVRTLAVWSDR